MSVGTAFSMDVRYLVGVAVKELSLSYNSGYIVKDMVSGL